MKKLSVCIFIVLGFEACNFFSPSPVVTKTKKRITLTGIQEQDASNMVANFRQNPTTSDPVTAIWLSKTWVDNVADLLTKENIADGFRIYFAKKSDGKNTIVIVSTMDDGPDTSESKADHLDYFGHDEQILNTISLPSIVEEYKAESGAKLYKNPPSDCTGCFPGAIRNNITCAEAYNAVKNFKVEAINCYSEWFPISLIRSLQEELNYNNAANLQDGIRIYFAKNLDTASNPKHNGRHSFIIVTTHKENNVDRTDYYSCFDPYNKHRNKSTADNGEQCKNNCNGVQLPTQ